MKFIYLIAFLIASTTYSAFANAIDKLNSDKDVQEFIYKLDRRFTANKGYIAKVIPTDTLKRYVACKDVAIGWNVNSWEKVDLNSDGLTDMIVTLQWYDFDSFAIIDVGNNTFQLTQLEKPFLINGCQIVKPIRIADQPILLFYSQTEAAIIGKTGSTVPQSKVDTLIYKYGGFIEYNSRPANSSTVKAVYLETTRCFGTCPVFKLKVAANGKATYDAGSFNPNEGHFKTQITKDRLNQVLSLLNYIDFEKLQKHYNPSVTDVATVKLKVTFDNGSSKVITDYGQAGSFGLIQLYKLLFDLRVNEKWH